MDKELCAKNYIDYVAIRSEFSINYESGSALLKNKLLECQNDIEEIHKESQGNDLCADDFRHVYDLVTDTIMDGEVILPTYITELDFNKHNKKQVTSAVNDFVSTVIEHGELSGGDVKFLLECKKEYLSNINGGD